MKTKNISLVILAEEPKKAPRTSADKPLLIRTENGELMTNRVRSLLRKYGNRVRIPTSLMLEVLEDRNRKSHQLRITKRDLNALNDLTGETIGVLLQLRNSANKLVEAIYDARSDNMFEDISSMLDALDNALEVADDFLDDMLNDCDCGDCHDDEAEA
ncbi:hypothetical protein IJV57_04495 [Candidatus Saccharibacteria bacterium]|nr:hypothetical protein [Candidatus Saccharibacteria bacterium]